GGGAALASLALELPLSGAIEVALQPGQVVEEESSLEVVDLVLERDREELFRLDLDLLLLGRPRTHEDAPCTLHRRRQIGNRETALLPYDLALALGDLGI